MIKNDSNAVAIALVAGARPNFMKIAPLLRVLTNDPDFKATLIHTGQHYDDNMSGQFFRDLRIPVPDYHLEVGSGTHAQQTAEIMKRLEPVMQGCSPSALVVVGDVNSTLAGALVAKKMGIEVIHAEAGLRSFDRTMPEEINRVVTDSISDLFLVTEQSGVDNLLKEGCDLRRIHLVGNLMIDSLLQNLETARQSDICERLGIKPKSFGLITLHRPANVDNHETLCEILDAFRVIADELPLIWPMHPRVKARLANARLEIPASIRILDPLGYLEFLSLEDSAYAVLTDSGGIQEESTVLGVECLTIRDNTERPVTIQSGTNRLAGTRRDTILSSWKAMRESYRKACMPPMWDGKAAERSRSVLRRYFSLDSHELTP